METGRKLAIGVVVYRNGKDELQRCFESIANQSDRTDITHLFVRDNDRGLGVDNVREALSASGIDGLSVEVSHGDNVGFGAAHNELMKVAFSGDQPVPYYLCLNPDGILHPLAVAKMLDFADERHGQGLFEAAQFPVPHPKVVNPDSTTPWCTGCCLLISSQAYSVTEGFDEAFWLYCEDVDLSWRAKAAGLDCFVVPGAKVAHHVHSRTDATAELPARVAPHLTAAATLALKWGAEPFAKRILSQLNDLTGVAPSLDELRVEFRPTAEDLRLASPDFTHDLHFASPTWSDE